MVEEIITNLGGVPTKHWVIKKDGLTVWSTFDPKIAKDKIKLVGLKDDSKRTE